MKDPSGEFGFLKPFFKEKFTTSLCLSNKCKLRTFLYNLAVTGDYYGTKLVEMQNGYYTQYFNLLCFSFYKKMPEIWPPLSHFTTQTIAKSKSQSDRHEFAILALVKFINCYAKSDNLQEGSAESLKSYLSHLAQMMITAVKKAEAMRKSTFDLENLVLFKIEMSYCVDFYEEQQSKNFHRGVTRKFEYSEFVEVLEKQVDIFELKSNPNFQETLELLYCSEASEKRRLLFDRIRNGFVGEPIECVMQVRNLLRVI